MAHDGVTRAHATPTGGGSPQSSGERTLVRVLRDAGRDLGVEVETFGDGWIVGLRDARSGARRFVYGYSFDLNPAGTHAICCDKGATSEVLHRAGVPTVPHRLFLHPRMAKFVAHSGTWKQLLSTYEEFGRRVVVKENAGTGGRDVVRCDDAVSFEKAVYALFERTTAIAVSPFLELAHEYRFVMLRGACELAYEKVRLSVTGDGARSVLELLAAHAGAQRAGGASQEEALRGLLEEMDQDQRAALLARPGAGEVRLLNWRHNLGQGASVRVLDVAAKGDAPLHAGVGEALRVAHEAARAVGLQFGSVDVVIPRKGGAPEATDAPRVLEINSGVMMEFLARTMPQGAEVARRVYARALRAMFEG